MQYVEKILSVALALTCFFLLAAEPSVTLGQGGVLSDRVLSGTTVGQISGARVSVQPPQNDAAGVADTLVICPRPFLQTLKPWLDYRRSQGHQVHWMIPGSSAYAVKQQIRKVAAQGRLKTVLLIGDTPSSDGTSQAWSVPTDYVAADLIRRFGSEPEIATDNTYADLDGDGVPELSIGRIAVDSRRQLENQIRKIIRYEATGGGEWQRRINLVAGTGGFGPLSDAVIEQTSRRLISDLIPPEYCTSMTYANWSSAYCPDPREFIPTTLERLNEGSLFWVYMGHGHPHRLDYVRTPIGGFPMFRDEDTELVNCQQGNPIALMLACYTGAFDLPKDCLAEKLVNQPGGPIAALCGSRVTMPCGMSLLSVGLIEEYFSGNSATLGEMFLMAKRKLMEPDGLAKNSPLTSTSQSQYRDTIRMLSKTLSPAGDAINIEAQEHVHLFHLLGDPLLRVNRPQQIQLSVEPTNDGETIRVSGYSPHQGTLMAELVYCRDRFQKRPPRRTEFKWDDESLDSYREVYKQSNQRTVTQRTVDVPAGNFQFELTVPDWARGRCVVRGYLQEQHSKRFALGPAL
ncbi:MAG: C25 family cysteine peptidase [Pirellulaceae bacterium]|nr:C25 family cysteine peptidase [Pirellulaceae bacterium]